MYSILTYNIHKGTNIFGFNTLPKIKQKLHLHSPDIICLQEVIERNLLNSNSQPKFLAEHHYQHVLYGEAKGIVKYSHGNAILSKQPVSLIKNIKMRGVGTGGRNFLHASIQLGNNTAHIINAHIGLLHKENTSQLKAVFEYASDTFSETDSVIICGDFNDHKKKHHSIIEHHGFTEAFEHNNPTYPSHYPIFSLDKIYTKNILVKNTIKCMETQSDHLLIGVIFDFPVN